MPGPGLNDMKPYGLVAAASTTSQTSMPMRSQRIASSLTSAMFTERKMFSSSLVSSAASGVETWHDVVADLLVELDRARAGTRRSGRRRSWACCAACSRCGRGRCARARRRGGSRARPRGPTPRAAGRSARASCPGRWSTRAPPAGRPGARWPARVPVAISGRGRARGWPSAGSARHDDHRVDLGQVGVARRRLEALGDRLQRLVRHVLDVRARPSPRAATTRASTSTPTTSCPASAKATTSGRPT